MLRDDTELDASFMVFRKHSELDTSLTMFHKHGELDTSVVVRNYAVSSSVRTLLIYR